MVIRIFVDAKYIFCSEHSCVCDITEGLGERHYKDIISTQQHLMNYSEVLFPKRLLQVFQILSSKLIYFFHSLCPQLSILIKDRFILGEY